MARVLVIGSINMDMVVRAEHLPTPGETVLGRDFQTIPGGKGANQAVGAARLGAQVAMYGKLGKDEFGQVLRDNLTAEGIDVTQIGVAEDVPSGIAIITLDETGQNSIVVASGANMQINPEEVITAWNNIKPVDVVVMQLEIPVACVTAAARVAKESGAKVVLNPAPARALPDDLLSMVDVLVPNESETEILTGEKIEDDHQAIMAAGKLLAKGVGHVILTLGSRGAMVVEQNKEAVILPPHSVDVVDTTAAGDAFVAGLSVRLAEKAYLVEAARFGNAAGALAVTRLGAQPAMPTREEVEKLLNA